MKLAFEIAWRFLKFSKKQTALIIIGIAVGVTVQVFIGLLMQGLQANIVQSTVGNSAQITVKPSETGKYIANYDEVMKEIRTVDGVKNVSHVIEFPAFLRLSNSDYSVFLRGFDFEEAEGIYRFSEKLISGNFPVEKNELLIGKDLSDKYGLNLNSEISLIVPPVVFLPRTFRVSGIYDFKNSTLNETWVLMKDNALVEIGLKGDVASTIEMQVDEIFMADKISSDVKDVIKNDDLTVSDWKSKNAELLSALNGQTVSSLLIQVFVIASVAITIASILAVSVMNKYKQVGILKAMGIDNSKTFLIFLFQGLILGIAGSIIGMALGVSLLVSFETFVKTPDGQPLVPISFDPLFLSISIAIATISASLASILPSRKAAKLDPVEVIKNG